MSKKDIDELIESANRLCANLDVTAQNEKAFCEKIKTELEFISWDQIRIANNIKEIELWRS